MHRVIAGRDTRRIRMKSMKAGPSRPRRMTVAVVVTAVASALLVTGCSGDSESDANKGADSPLSQSAAAGRAPGEEDPAGGAPGGAGGPHTPHPPGEGAGGGRVGVQNGV